jgi:hypothetical protein
MSKIRLKCGCILGSPNCQHKSAQSPASPVATAPESAWLIERAGLCLGFCEYRFTWVTFTNEDALRFSRQRDAYSFMEAVKGTPFSLPLEGSVTTEHRWGL